MTWTGEGESIIVWCASKTFTHQILSDPDDGAPEFFSDDDDPVIVTLTTDELCQLETLGLKRVTSTGRVYKQAIKRVFREKYHDEPLAPFLSFLISGNFQSRSLWSGLFFLSGLERL